MVVFIFTKKITALKEKFPKTAVFLDFTALSDHTPDNGDMTYFDVSNFTVAELNNLLSRVKKNFKDKLWGIIDAKGFIKDTASLFFSGASDYLSAEIFKDMSPVNLRRIKAAVQYKLVFGADKPAEEKTNNNGINSAISGAEFINTGIKLPSKKIFHGWNKMQPGQNMPFYLLYCSLQGRIPLDTRLNDRILSQVYKRFSSCLEDYFLDGDALLWINSGWNCLFLIPPRIKCAEAAIKSCFEMIVSAPLIVFETLGVTIPSNFVFALHYGTLSYRPPGKTGTLVSDAVNFIFHLGNRKAEPGRLTVSGELPDNSIPQALGDCFCAAGVFENRKVWHSRKFNYEKPWL